MTGPTALIIGAYGVVGTQIVELLAHRNPELSLVVAGRSIAPAEELATRFENARAVRVDVDDKDPLAAIDFSPDAILAVANDADDNLLLAAVRRAIPYIDITRWTERVHRAIERVDSTELSSPVILSSGWMAGVVATVTAKAAQGFSRINNIDIDILYALKDKAGVNSVEYVDRLAIPFTVRINGSDILAKPLSDPHMANFANGVTCETFRLDTPDQYSLVRSLNAAGVSTRIAYDDAAAIKSLRFLLRSGIWRILMWRPFDGVRKSMLFNPGDGAPHEISVTIDGSDLAGAVLKKNVLISDPLGQTHMTATGAVAQVERVLKLRGRTPAPAGISFPENAADLDNAVTHLVEMGVMVKF